ncbi:MAG: leucine-rich repeat domain-containing protein [Oscillospiraceae bacterium]|nr:leucine-rich repeat domain-containing protein [Oscillospiraceae bacterium]
MQIPSHIPDFVEVIEKECFYLCTEFKVVEIPNSMSRIGDKCFFCCSSLLELQGF